jgi:hypothetical protein
MPSPQLKLLDNHTRYNNAQLLQLRRQMPRYARSLPRGSSERNDRRQIASSLRSLFRDKIMARRSYRRGIALSQKRVSYNCRKRSVSVVSRWGYPDRGNTAMSKKAAEHHKQSQEHHTHAARHHGEAAKHHEGGHHEKAAHHAHTARGHALHARHHSDEAAKAHMEEHGKK